MSRIVLGRAAYGAECERHARGIWKRLGQWGHGGHVRGGIAELQAVKETLRAGPPPWLHVEVLAKSREFDVADAHVYAEAWAGGIRFFSRGFAEDDAAWDHEEWATYFSLEEAVCLCNTLATGKDTHFAEEAWGRVYERVFSLDSHTRSEEKDPARQEIWFYPMTERRMVFRMVVGPLVGVMRELCEWAQEQLEHVDEDKQGAQRRLLRRGIELLEVARRRIGG
ncbi:MAG TPA: hypothetical protein PK156_40120 [Polyangium sp.]|nr:hypothetical protein [Polyangium sp.]